MIQPRNDMVLVRRLPIPEEQTAGGICLPLDRKQEFVPAEVLAVGPGHYLDSGAHAVIDDLKPGDTVLIQNDGVDPNGRVVVPRLIPVNPGGDECLVLDGYIVAVEISDDRGVPPEIREQEHLIGEAGLE